MQRSGNLLGLLRQSLAQLPRQESSSLVSLQQLRFIGGDKVPEFWGKPSPYTEGTSFLGTPKDHQERIKKRPLSPDVFEIDGKSPHYAFPWGARSSILNRITGVALSVGFAGAGYVALTGDLPGALMALKANYPALVFPAKFAITYPLVYHYLGGVRHVVWDLHTIGNQAEHNSLLETQQVELSSKAIVAAGLGISLLLSIL